MRYVRMDTWNDFSKTFTVSKLVSSISGIKIKMNEIATIKNFVRNHKIKKWNEIVWMHMNIYTNKNQEFMTLFHVKTKNQHCTHYFKCIKSNRYFKHNGKQKSKVHFATWEIEFKAWTKQMMIIQQFKFTNKVKETHAIIQFNPWKIKHYQTSSRVRQQQIMDKSSWNSISRWF